MQIYVYIMSNNTRGALYIGVTSDLIKRTWQHKEFFVDGFCEKYGLKCLVWYEVHEDITEAIKREKQGGFKVEVQQWLFWLEARLRQRRVHGDANGHRKILG